MTQDALKQFQTALETDESFHDEFLAAKSFDQVVAAAARRGWVVTVDDLKALSDRAAALAEGELSDTDLHRVGGGKGGYGSLGFIASEIAKVNKLHEQLENILKDMNATIKPVAQALR